MKRYFPVVIFSISLFYCCVFLLFSLKYQQQHDALEYIQYAKDIASNGLLKCNTSREVGYSILISPLFFFFSEPAAIMLSRFTNIILFSLSAAIFYLTIKILLPQASTKRILIFSLLFSLSPQLSSFSALRVYSEPLQILLNSIILFCFAKIFSKEANLSNSANLKFWIIAALASGYLTITKAFFAFYPLWLSFFIFVYAVFIQKIRYSVKSIIKPMAILLCLAYLPPFLWNQRDYHEDNNTYIANKFSLNLLNQAYLVEWGIKDELKWGVFQVSNNLGEFIFSNDAQRMRAETGEIFAKSRAFLSKINYGKDYKFIINSTLMEWQRLVTEHPLKYILCYYLNILNQLLLEGIYPNIYPTYRTNLVHYIYLINALILHFLYSIFIWMVIISGLFIYILKRKAKLLQQLKFKYTIIIFSLGYFIFFAYHFHTEMRYFYPFYINIYVLFALSCDYLTRKLYKAKY